MTWKPVGLTDPATGDRPYAVVQLRPENAVRSCYSLVACQSRMTWPEQRRIFRMIPGLAEAEFLRLGGVHRNTYLDAPRLIDANSPASEAGPVCSSPGSWSAWKGTSSPQRRGCWPV